MGQDARIHPRQTKIALICALVGAVLGYGVGNYAGSLVEGALWGVFMGIACYFLAIAQLEPSWRQNLIAIAFHGGQVCIFAAIGALISWTTNDVTIFPLCLKLGFLLSMLTGIVDWELPREMPGGFFFLLGLFIGVGAGVGMMVAILFQFNVGAGASISAFMAIILPYYFFQINARPIFLSFVIFTFGGMQVIATQGMSLLQGYYFTTFLTFAIAMVLISIEYLRIHVWKRSRLTSFLPYLRL
jgi:hypothetical protein